MVEQGYQIIGQDGTPQRVDILEIKTTRLPDHTFEIAVLCRDLETRKPCHFVMIVDDPARIGKAIKDRFQIDGPEAS